VPRRNDDRCVVIFVLASINAVETGEEPALTGCGSVLDWEETSLIIRTITISLKKT
jgi:hypothetical protein